MADFLKMTFAKLLQRVSSHCDNNEFLTQLRNGSFSFVLHTDVELSSNDD